MRRRRQPSRALEQYLEQHSSWGAWVRGCARRLVRRAVAWRARAAAWLRRGRRAWLEFVRSRRRRRRRRESPRLEEALRAFDTTVRAVRRRRVEEHVSGCALRVPNWRALGGVAPVPVISSLSDLVQEARAKVAAVDRQGRRAPVEIEGIRVELLRAVAARPLGADRDLARAREFLEIAAAEVFAAELAENDAALASALASADAATLLLRQKLEERSPRRRRRATTNVPSSKENDHAAPAPAPVVVFASSHDDDGKPEDGCVAVAPPTTEVVYSAEVLGTAEDAVFVAPPADDSRRRPDARALVAELRRALLCRAEGTEHLTSSDLDDDNAAQEPPSDVTRDPPSDVTRDPRFASVAALVGPRLAARKTRS